MNLSSRIFADLLEFLGGKSSAVWKDGEILQTAATSICDIFQGLLQQIR